MLWWNMERYRNRDGIICDGSIRSGKTVSMTLGFFLWSMSRFNGQSFAICGRTIESLRRNVITHVPSWLEGVLTVKERRSENKLVVTMGNRQNTYYLFGGRDESSYTLIQGITLAGVLFDEVALMPRSFVEQAMARCSVSGSKFWFNCNPESPQHWFYREWIQQHTARNILYLHFTMADNFSLDAKIKARYEGMYAGVFYDRYIRGLWTVAEGLIYTLFSPGVHVVDTRNMEFDAYILSCDYGTLNPTSIGLWGLSGRKMVPDSGVLLRWQESAAPTHRRRTLQRLRSVGRRAANPTGNCGSVGSFLYCHHQEAWKIPCEARKK